MDRLWQIKSGKGSIQHVEHEIHEDSVAQVLGKYGVVARQIGLHNIGRLFIYIELGKILIEFVALELLNQNEK